MWTCEIINGLIWGYFLRFWNSPGLLQTRHVDLSSLIIIIIIIIIIITVIILDARGPHVSRRATYTNTCSLVCWLAEFTDLL